MKKILLGLIISFISITRAEIICYKVKAGDTLWAIARKAGISISEIKRLNGEIKVLHPGDILLIEPREIGWATFYGGRFHGRRTYYGEIYDKNSPTTCAHNLYPHNTLLKVTNLENGKFVIVRVTDTGNWWRWWPDRIIDLSEGAFKRLAPLSKGKIWVKIEPLNLERSLKKPPLLPITIYKEEIPSPPFF